MAAGRALLFYRPGSDKVDWCLLDKDNLREGAFKSSSIDKLADDVYGKELILAFPGEDVLIRQLSLPRATGVNPAQLIPNLLEESLVEDIEQLEKVTALFNESGATSIVTAKDDAERALFWKGRKSAFPAVGIPPGSGRSNNRSNKQSVGYASSDIGQ